MLVNKLRVLGLVKKGPGYHPVQRLRFGLTTYAAENRITHNIIKIKCEHVVIDRNITQEILPWQYICINRQILHIVPSFRRKNSDFIAFTTTDLVLISYLLG